MGVICLRPTGPRISQVPVFIEHSYSSFKLRDTKLGTIQFLLRMLYCCFPARERTIAINFFLAGLNHFRYYPFHDTT